MWILKENAIVRLWPCGMTIALTMREERRYSRVGWAHSHRTRALSNRAQTYIRFNEVVIECKYLKAWKGNKDNFSLLLRSRTLRGHDGGGTVRRRAKPNEQDSYCMNFFENGFQVECTTNYLKVPTDPYSAIAPWERRLRPPPWTRHALQNICFCITFAYEDGIVFLCWSHGYASEAVQNKSSLCCIFAGGGYTSRLVWKSMNVWLSSYHLRLASLWLAKINAYVCSLFVRSW